MFFEKNKMREIFLSLFLSELFFKNICVKYKNMYDGKFSRIALKCLWS